MSLLFGFGRGLSDAAMMINRGMAEDRQSERQLELEKMREASIEKRWSRETAMRQSERQADREQRAAEMEANRNQRATERAEDRQLRESERAADLEYRKGRDSQSDSQFNRQMSMREKQVIESNLSSVIDRRRKEEQEIVNRYQKMGELGGVTAQMQEQMASEISAVRQHYDQQLGNMISSYGEGIKGTGFEYLLNYNEQPSAADSSGENNTADTAGNKRDLSGHIGNILSDKPAADGQTQDASYSPWMTGFNYGTKGVYGDDSKTSPDVSELSLLDRGFYQGGRSAGLLFGLPKDAGQYASEKLKPFTQRLTETPEQRRLRLSQNNGR